MSGFNQTSLENQLCVALLAWELGDGIVEMMHHEIRSLGHSAIIFTANEPVPAGSQLILSHGPHSPILPLWRRFAHWRETQSQPVAIAHWNTEGFPDLRIPLSVMKQVGALRSAVDRWSTSTDSLATSIGERQPVKWLRSKMNRYRYLGDYDYAYNHNWLDILADSSQIYVQYHQRRGIPALYVPWGSSQPTYADFQLERDIDVLWMGKQGSRRRSAALNYVLPALRERGINVYIADNNENPFIFNEERTCFLNRAKITLNLTRTWYDDNFSRFAFAMPNRSLVVSEPLLPHCPEYEANVHYVSADVKELPDIIQHYLIHEDERLNITESAFELITTKLKFRHSIQRIVDSASTICHPKLIKNE